MERKSIAYMIIGLGILALLKYVGVPMENLFNYIIGAGLLLAYVQTAKDGRSKNWLMIIGVFFVTKGVLGSINDSFIFAAVEDYLSPFIIGLGFYSIYFIGEHTSYAHYKDYNWAKGIAKFFFFIGTFALVMSFFGFAIGFVFRHFWPIVLISLGASILLKGKQ